MKNCHLLIPRKRRATKKPGRFWTTPSKIATTPHARVRVGNQNLGVVLLRTILQGICNGLISAKMIGDVHTNLKDDITNEI